MLPETYLKLKYPEDIEKQTEQARIVLEQRHFEEGVGRVIPSISLEELRRYEELRDKYSVAAEK